MHVPGWYPDPAVPGQERWWGGQSFTDHVRPVEPLPVLAPVAPAAPAAPEKTAFAGLPQAPPLAPPPAAGREPRYGERPLTPSAPPTGSFFPDLQRQSDIRMDLADGKNSHATLGLVFAILSLFGLSLGWILGIVFGTLGLTRARRYADAGYPAIGRTKSIWTLALSAAGIAVTILLVVVAVRSDSRPYSEVVETTLVQQLRQEDGLVVTVDCPQVSTAAAGDYFQCVATDDEGVEHVIDVDVQDGSGFFVWSPPPSTSRAESARSAATRAPSAGTSAATSPLRIPATAERG